MSFTLGLLIALLSVVGAADQSEERQFSPQTGLVTVGDNLATIDVPDGMRFMPPADARYLLEQVWKNPPDPTVIGMVIATPSPDQEDLTVIVVSYTADGHVADDDAKGIDYASLLSEMQASAREQSEALVAEGFRSVELLGWAEEPHYDATAKKLFWAKSLRFGNQPDATLNYCIRVLGRVGVLELNALGKTAGLKRIGAAAQQIMGKTAFTTGNRYEDYQEGTDLKAAGGITALIIGGVVAKKLGLIALIGFGILKFAKILIIPALFGGGWLVSWLKKRRDRQKTSELDELAELERRRHEDIKRSNDSDRSN